MRILSLIVFILSISVIADAQNLINAVLDNTVDINSLKLQSNIKDLKNSIKLKKAGSSFSNTVCNSGSDILVQLGDSLYNYDEPNNTYSYITAVAPGISTSFDVIERDNQSIIVSAVQWDSIYYFKDNAWTYSGFGKDSSSDLIHTGCGKHSTFLMGGNLWHFNGNSDPKMIRPNIHYAIADLAVDERDNAWVLTGKTWPYADTLRIIDSTGRSLCDIPFKTPISTVHGYGMMIHNGKAIVGFGSSNPNFPNKWVALNIDTVQHYVTFEQPVPVNPTLTIDLGGCSKVISMPNCNTVDTYENTLPISEVKVSPVPFSEQLTLTYPEGKVAAVKIFDLLGRAILSETCQGNSITLNTGTLERGMYMIQIVKGNHSVLNLMSCKQ